MPLQCNLIATIFTASVPWRCGSWGPITSVLHPNLTTVQAAAARLKVGWHEARVISLHGRGWEALDAAVTTPGLIFIYTDPLHTPEAIAHRLLASGRTGLRLCVLEDLGQTTEQVAWLSLTETAGRTFSPLNLVVLDRAGPSAADSGQPPLPGPTSLHLGMPEEAYAPERGLITKAEVRAAILASLRLHPGQVLWDIGAGSGSVGLEASLLLTGGRIVAMERNPGRAAQISANRDKFGVTNLEVVGGEAPGCLAGLPAPHRVFIGGGGDRLGDILREALGRLLPGGVVVVSATLLDTLEETRRVLSQANWLADVVQIQVSRGQPLSGSSYLKALNPVWLITGTAQAR